MRRDRATMTGAAGGLGLVLALACATAASAAPDAKLKSDAAAAFTAPSAVGVSTDSAAQPWSPPTPHKTLQRDSRGRWGVRLDMEQPSGRSADWKDVSAGAYLSLNSRLRIGGSVGLGDKFSNPAQLTPRDAAPRVKLETRFKF